MHLLLTFCLVCCFITACYSCHLDCSTVKCAVPDCIDKYTPPHECCPICRPKLCNYKGQVYTDGQQFKDDCNTCTCSSGSVSCTQIGCPVNHTTCTLDGVDYPDGKEELKKPSKTNAPTTSTTAISTTATATNGRKNNVTTITTTTTTTTKQQCHHHQYYYYCFYYYYFCFYLYYNNV